MIIQHRYRMRAGNPMPAINDLFFYQTFMAEKVRVDIYEAKRDVDLLVTDNFRGRGGEFISANYTRLPYKDTSGNIMFSGNEEHIPEYIDEDDVPGA